MLAAGIAPARRVPARRRRARVVRPGGAAAAPSPLAGPAAARDRAGRAAALARFLPRWQGIGERRTGIDRLAEVIAQLEGMPLPASVLERDVLPARVRGYSPRLLDELGAAGEVVWVGLGSLGRDDGRVALYRPDRLPLLAARRPTRPCRPDRPDWAPRRAPRAPGRRAAPRSTATSSPQRCAPPPSAASGPSASASCSTRCGTSSGRPRSPTTRSRRCARCAGRAPVAAVVPACAGRALARPRFASTARMGPPEAAGRWSLVSEAIATAVALRGGTGRHETERRHAQALRLLDAYGVVTRDTVAGEGLPRRLLGGLPGPARDGGARPRPPRLLRRGPRRRPVRMPAALDRLRAERADAGGDRPARARGGAAPRRDRPGQPVRRRAGLAALVGRRPAAAGARPPARTSCSIDGEPVVCISSAAASRSRRCPAFADREAAERA